MDRGGGNNKSNYKNIIPIKFIGLIVVFLSWSYYNLLISILRNFNSEFQNTGVGELTTYKQTDYSFHHLSESAVMITFGNHISKSIHIRVQQFIATLHECKFEGYIESIPSYTGVTIFFDPMTIKRKYMDKNNEGRTVYEVVLKILSNIIKELDSNLSIKESKVIEIPVYYGPPFGPDIEDVAKVNGKNINEVISLHSEREYLVYMIGFAPGFPFLGGMSKEIATPRRKSPRLKIPAGTVGIAGEQTGVYPIETPGGWQLIGKTPLRLFDSTRKNPTLLRPGDKVQFKPVSLQEFKKLEERV